MRSDFKIPGVLYESLSIFLLLAVVAAGALIPLAAYPVLRGIGKLSRAGAGSIAAHYGSVSVVTFAVGSSYLTRLGETAEVAWPAGARRPACRGDPLVHRGLAARQGRAELLIALFLFMTAAVSAHLLIKAALKLDPSLRPPGPPSGPGDPKA